jgi:hypothetical protein
MDMDCSMQPTDEIYIRILVKYIKERELKEDIGIVEG